MMRTEICFINTVKEIILTKCKGFVAETKPHLFGLSNKRLGEKNCDFEKQKPPIKFALLFIVMPHHSNIVTTISFVQ